MDNLGSAEVEDKAEQAFETLGNILSNIGIRESIEKPQPPEEVATFLGVLFNTLQMIMSMTPDRLIEIKQILGEWKQRKSATLKELQQLLGKLNFLCSTVKVGRVFVSRLINTIKTHPVSGKRRVLKELLKDVSWWDRYLTKFDGRVIIPQINWAAPDTIFSMDSCLTGCGGWSKGEYFHAEFPDWILRNTDVHINELEALALVIGLKLWIDRISNANILIYCDNKVTVDIVNTGRASNKFTQKCLREICWLTASSNAVVKVVHLESAANRISDALSRWHLSKEYRNTFFNETKH